jgi:hypothetical protein
MRGTPMVLIGNSLLAPIFRSRGRHASTRPHIGTMIGWHIGAFDDAGCLNDGAILHVILDSAYISKYTSNPSVFVRANAGLSCKRGGGRYQHRLTRYSENLLGRSLLAIKPPSRRSLRCRFEYIYRKPAGAPNHLSARTSSAGECETLTGVYHAVSGGFPSNANGRSGVISERR